MDARRETLPPERKKTTKAVMTAEHLKTPDGPAIKITLPYLDWRINPSDLEFDERNPNHSPIADKKNRSLTHKKFLNIHNYQHTDTYSFYKKIGSGAFGTVSLAQNQATNEWIAIKEFAHGIPDDQHKNPDAANVLFVDTRQGYIGMKLLEGHELFDVVADTTDKRDLLDSLFNDRDKKDNESLNTMADTQPETQPSLPLQHFSLLQKIAIAKSVLKNMAHLHHDVGSLKKFQKPQHRIIHRDIKCDNICLNAATHTVAYCDYDSAINLENEDNQQSIQSKVNDQPKTNETQSNPTPGNAKRGIAGTLPYIAPEIYDVYHPNDRGSQYQYNEKTEVFALGITLAMIFGIADPDPSNDNRYILIERPEDIPQGLYDLIRDMVQYDADQRPTVVYATHKLNFLLNEVGKSTALNACVISITDFLGLSPIEEKQVIKNMITQKMNAIVLHGSKDSTNKDYYDVRYKLIQAGIINVAPFMVKSESNEAVCHIAKDHYDQTLCTVKTQVYYYGTSNKNYLDLMKAIVNDEVFWHGKLLSRFGISDTIGYQKTPGLIKKIKKILNEHTSDDLKVKKIKVALTKKEHAADPRKFAKEYIDFLQAAQNYSSLCQFTLRLGQLNLMDACDLLNEKETTPNPRRQPSF